ncbi:MAG TPA: histidinol-phosphatase HisJ family protein [Clostridiaceae bacterium]|nr:histidinol-phosphatase HisJ family protein [Clostridiaceae bacterium]
MIVDSHNHLSEWSPDAVQTFDEMMQSATEIGLTGIVATDHYDIGSLTPYGKEWVLDPEAYRQEMYPRRVLPSERKPGDLPGFLYGIEIGYLPQHIDRLRALIADYPWDIVIMSLHLINGYDPFHSPDEVYKSSLEETYRNILTAIAESAAMLPEANIIGHYDYFSRYAPHDHPKMLYRHAPREFDRLFRIMIENEQALEINTATIWKLQDARGYSLEEAMPDSEVLQRYLELGGNLISISSDAHSASNVGRLVPETCAWLQEHGVNDHVWFENGKLFRAPFEQSPGVNISEVNKDANLSGYN